MADRWQLTDYTLTEAALPLYWQTGNFTVLHMVTGSPAAAIVASLAFSDYLSRSALGVAAFWPANALLLGLLLRNPSWARGPTAWICALAGYLTADMLTGAPWLRALGMNGANLLGVAVGIASYTAPLYLSEMASENVRGKMISMYQLMVTLGIVLAFLSDTYFSYSGNWRAMLGVLALPALVLIVLVIFLPNSPRWLAEKGRHVEAEEVLRMLRDTSEKARDELNEIRESLKLKQGGWALFKVNRNVRRAVFLGMLLQAMQQFTGMNIIMYYAPRIFKMAGFTTTEQQMVATLVVGLTFMFATFIAVFTVDKAGRKPALKIGFSVMAIGTLVLGYCLMQFDNGTASSGLSWLSVGMTMMCIAGYAMSAAPVVWILCSEIQPLKCRDFGITCSTTTNWVSNMIIGATFLTLLDSIGAAGTFWLYTALNIAFIGVTFWLIPETKGVTLEHIERKLMAGEKLRNIGV